MATTVYASDVTANYPGATGIGGNSGTLQSKLLKLLDGQFSPSDPSYQWRFQQGQQAVERSLAAKGLLNSGNAALELQQYGQGAASTEYQAQFARLLQALTGVGNLEVAQGELGVHQGQLAVQQGQLGVQQGQLSLAGDELDLKRQLGMGQLSLGQDELALKRQAQQWQQDYYSNLNAGLGAALNNRSAPSYSDIMTQWATLFNNMSGNTPAVAAPTYTTYTPTANTNYNGYEASPASTFNYSYDFGTPSLTDAVNSGNLDLSFWTNPSFDLGG